MNINLTCNAFWNGAGTSTSTATTAAPAATPARSPPSSTTSGATGWTTTASRPASPSPARASPTSTPSCASELVRRPRLLQEPGLHRLRRRLRRHAGHRLHRRPRHRLHAAPLQPPHTVTWIQPRASPPPSARRRPSRLPRRRRRALRPARPLRGLGRRRDGVRPRPPRPHGGAVPHGQQHRARDQHAPVHDRRRPGPRPGTPAPWAAAAAPPAATCNLLAVDDDNGNLTDGTPHMTAIRAAFERHEIHCATPAAAELRLRDRAHGRPTVHRHRPATEQVSPQLDGGAERRALRRLPHRGRGRAATSARSRSPRSRAPPSPTPGCWPAGPYSYIVMPVGANPSCFGRASNCASTTPQTPPLPRGRLHAELLPVDLDDYQPGRTAPAAPAPCSPLNAFSAAVTRCPAPACPRA